MNAFARNGAVRRGAALILTLLIVSLLAIVVVAFMRAMSLARTTARSYGDIERATMAAEAGLGMAAGQIVTAVGTNSAFVTGITNFPDANYPVTVVGQSDLTNAAQLMPLISGDASQWAGFGQAGWAGFAPYAAARTNSAAAATVDLNTSQQFIQQTNDANMYRAPWVVVTNVVGAQTNYARFAYVVLDDQARLNPLLHTGASNGIKVNPTNCYIADPTNIFAGAAILSLTNSDAQRLTPGQMTKVLGNPQAFAWSGTSLGQTFGARADYEAVKHLFTAQTNPTYDMIPAWLAEGGKPKYNINDLATNSIYGSSAGARARNIAQIISQNLPSFCQRDPVNTATNNQTYVNRLAANIVDYIDSGSVPTTSVGSDNFTGMKATVFPYMIVEGIQCPPPAGGGVSAVPHTSATVNSTFYVACMNPFNIPVRITRAELTVSNRPPYTFAGQSQTPLPYDKLYIGNILVNPNQYVVIPFPSVQAVTFPGPVPATTSSPASVGTVGGQWEQYQFKVNNQVVAQSKGFGTTGVQAEGGLEMDPVASLRNGTNSWYMAQLDHFGTEAADPRMASFYSTVWASFSGDANYLNGTFVFNGRNTDNGQGHDSFYLQSQWIYRDSGPRGTGGGTAPATLLQTPDQVAVTYNQATAAPTALAYIRQGPMVSIGELGHIFDPAQVNDVLTTNDPMVNGTLGSGSSARYVSIYQQGGGRSLRIGQPESTGAIPGASPSFTSDTWDTAGKRALNLLDLFTVNSTNGVGGRININTASPEALSVIFSGIELTSDTEPRWTTPPAMTNSASIAAFVITNRPYSSLSELYKMLPAICTNAAYGNNPLIAPINNFLIPSGNPVDPEWSAFDRVREEAFSKIVQHFCVQSRTYRIYVVGQTLDARQNPHGSSILEACLYLRWDASASRFTPVIQYERLLK